MSEIQQEITALLGAWRSGDSAAENELMALLYPRVLAMAGRHLDRLSGPITLQAGDLANEAFIKLFGQREPRWQNRQHFLAIAARVVRRVVLDHLKGRSCDKRGGGALRITLDRVAENAASPGVEPADALNLESALAELEREDPESVRLIELRYFAGLSVEEAADVLGVSVSTAVRNWRAARAWLHARLR
ncbi:MAG TPA: ECF-type sigma factor [Xanthomonadaceae bacterium]|nr:ECF-type sigma factor [Xanthomonadaceae bacterium]